MPLEAVVGWTSFKSRIGFWLKKSPFDTTYGELVELASLLIELSDAIYNQSIVSVISELPQLTKFLYRIVTEPHFRVILATKRVSLSFCRCLQVFIRSSLQGSSNESEPPSQEIRTKSREWALVVLRLALSPRWMDKSNNNNTAQGTRGVPSILSGYAANSHQSLVGKQMRKQLVNWIDYHAFHITRKGLCSDRCFVYSCPYKLETHYKALKDIGLFLLSILQPGDEEEHWCLPIVYHWLLTTVHLEYSILELQVKGLQWEKGYTSRTISLRIPESWFTLPAPVMFRLLLENDSQRRQYCDWLESLVLRHLFLCDMVLLDTDVLSNDHRAFLLKVLREPVLVCWIRTIWFEKIENCLDQWNKRVLVLFWNAVTRHCHPFAVCDWESVLISLQPKTSDCVPCRHLGMNPLTDIHVVGAISSFNKSQEACFIRKYFWESVGTLERHFVLVCWKATLHCISEQEFRFCVMNISKWWCIPSLSSNFRCWNTESYFLFQYICCHYDSLIRGMGPLVQSNQESTTTTMLEENSHSIPWQYIFVDILFHTLSCVFIESSFQSLDSNDGYILLYMKIMETILEYSANHSNLLLVPSDTKYQRLFQLYRQISNQDSSTANQRKRRYQLFCKHNLCMEEASIGSS